MGKNYDTFNKKELIPKLREELLLTLKKRFENNTHLRHPELMWTIVEARLLGNPQKLWSLSEMERTGGEPDLIEYDAQTGEYVFYDCSQESPVGRRNTCYDREAMKARKEHRPESNAKDLAAAMGIEMLTEEQYRRLQTFGSYDLKTSSWIKTPDKIRKLGGALFCDRRYDTVFVYHNGAESYYASRGFRGCLKI